MRVRRPHLGLAHLGLALAVAGVLGAPVAGAATAPQQATQPTDLLVRLTNGAGEAVAGQEVFVVVSDGREVAEELTGTTDDEGELRFAGVPAASGFTARPVSVFEGYPYQGEAVALTPGEEALLPLTVFTVSDEAANLHIEVFHIILNVIEPGAYQVLQVMSVLNVDGRAVYTDEEFDDRRVGMVIPVPRGASGVAPVPEISGLDPDDLAEDGDRLLDFRPVPPGSHQVAVLYDLFTDADGDDIEITLPYPTAQVSLLVGPGLGVVVIESEQLQELDPVEIPGQGEYAEFTSDVIAAGDTLRFRIRPAHTPMSAGAWALLGLAGALLASAAASIFLHSAPTAEPIERSDLIAEVARLDAQHDSGALADAEYHQLRAAAIGRLMELDGTSGPPTGE